MKLLTYLVICTTLALWPLSLMLTNAFKDIGNDLKNYSRFSVFAPDDQAPLIINAKRSVYDNDFIGRLFNNKATFIWGRFKANFFALIDPNNYFFGFHPREIVRENMNLDKFPFISIAFLLYGLYRINLMKWRRALFFLFFGLVSLLSLANFDKVDFVLYPILAYIIIFGLKRLKHEKPSLFFVTSLLLIIFSVPQYMRLLVNLNR